MDWILLASISRFHIGDMLAQIFFLGFIVLIIILIVTFILSSKKRKHQLDRLEEKVDSIVNKLDSDR